MKRFLYLLLIPLILSSCATYIAPTYTSVDKMLQIEKGMSSDKVDETLGIKPYNMLHRNDSTSVFEYHYRLKDRDVNNISNYKKFIHLEQSQTGGKNWFTKPSKFYVLYEDNRFSTLITENGLENSDYLLLKNNNLMLVSQSDLVEFDLWEDASYLHRIDNTSKLKATKTIKRNILYSMYLPYGAIGLKYAVGGKIGGYASAGISIDHGVFSYITGGFIFRTSAKTNIYFGGGVGPYIYTDDNYWVYYEYLYLDSFVLEAGALFNVKWFSLDTGLGYNIDEGVFGKLGFGINF